MVALQTEACDILQSHAEPGPSRLSKYPAGRIIKRFGIILYWTEDGYTHVQCRFEDETVWLTQRQMAELFQTFTQNVSLLSIASLPRGNRARIQ